MLFLLSILFLLLYLLLLHNALYTSTARADNRLHKCVPITKTLLSSNELIKTSNSFEYKHSLCVSILVFIDEVEFSKSIWFQLIFKSLSTMIILLTILLLLLPLFLSSFDKYFLSFACIHLLVCLTLLLSDLSKKVSSSDIRNEYQNLFIGVGRGELLPFGSFYITGFLHDKPLASIRRDLNAMGIKRGDDFKEPEDHIACLCEIMSGMITGEYGKYFSVPEQRSFFKKHIQPWAEHFFTDLEGAKSAIFYSPVGTIGKLFINIEEEAFSMDASR